MRIALIVSRQGPGGLWAVTCDACTMLAVAELNAGGGVLVRDVEPVPGDAGTTLDGAAFAARNLVEIEDVDAVFAPRVPDPRNCRSRRPIWRGQPCGGARAHGSSVGTT